MNAAWREYSLPDSLRNWVEENIPDQKAFYLNQGMDERAAAHFAAHPIKIKIHTDSNTGSFLITLGSVNRQLISFELRAYYKCCAMVHFINFMHSQVPEATLHSFVGAVVRAGLIGMWFNSKRLIVAMVETRPSVNNVLLADRTTHNFRAIPDPSIQYPLFYTFFKKQRKCTTLGVMYNTNSGALINLLEVII